MALIKCPECRKKISDRSLVCVHCGFPLPSLQEESQNNNTQNLPADEDFGFIWQHTKNAIVWLYNHLLYRLLVNAAKAENKRSFADTFVACYLITSVILAIVVLKLSIPTCPFYLILEYTLYRIYEITIYSLNTFFIAGYQENEDRSKRMASSRRSLLFLFFNVFELTNLFIVLGVFWCWFNHIEYFTNSYAESFMNNFYCFLTFSPEAITEGYPILKNMAFIEVLFGFIFLLTTASRIVSSFRPYATLEDEKLNSGDKK